MKNLNFTKKEISREINSKLGLPISFCNEVVDTLIEILIDNIKSKELNVKNFGTFKVLYKKCVLVEILKQKRFLKFQPENH